LSKIATIVLLLILLPLTGSASDDLALEAMEVLRRGFSVSSDFTAQIRQEKKLALMQRTLVSRGFVRFKKPDLFFMEMYPPHASKLLLKDNLMTMRLVEQGITNHVALPPEQSLKKWFDYLARPVQAIPEGMEVKAQRRGKLWTLQISPRSPGAVQQLTLNFDQEGKLSRLGIEERNHDRTTLIFSNLRRNVGLQDKDFQLD
jgi:outer membrane lipoprotein carrier protein